MLIEKQLSYIFSSNPANGARNVSADGSQFSVQLDAPIAIPAEAISATLECQSAQIWWVVPQISEQLGNNTFYLHAEYVPPGRVLPADYPDYTITIPDGLYSLEGLGVVVSREVVNLGLPANLVTLTGDDSTQRVIVTFNSDDPTWIDFTQPNTFREILGFDERLVPLLPQLSGYSELSDDPARFNQISSFLIGTDLISNGIPVNNISSGVVANVLIDVKPGSLINYTPVISVKTDASELIGKSKNFFSFRLTDQDRRTVDTNDEYYSLTVIIKYYEPFTQSTRLTSAASRG
jgi:hypothetical protein